MRSFYCARSTSVEFAVFKRKKERGTVFHPVPAFQLSLPSLLSRCNSSTSLPLAINTTLAMPMNRPCSTLSRHLAELASE